MSSSSFMHTERHRVQRFFIVGPINALVSFTGFWIAISLFERTLVAILIATGCGWLFSYTTNRKLVWSSIKRESHPFRFVILQIFLILINWIVLNLMTRNENIDVVIAQAILIPFLAISSFIGSEYWVYPRGSEA